METIVRAMWRARNGGKDRYGRAGTSHQVRAGRVGRLLTARLSARWGAKADATLRYPLGYADARMQGTVQLFQGTHPAACSGNCMQPKCLLLMLTRGPGEEKDGAESKMQLQQSLGSGKDSRRFQTPDAKHNNTRQCQIEQRGRGKRRSPAESQTEQGVERRVEVAEWKQLAFSGCNSPPRPKREQKKVFKCRKKK